MTFRKSAFVLILTVAFTEVATWTIDLPEVRKLLFERTEKYKKHDEYEDYLSKDQKFYSNIEGNSKHHSEDYKHEHYSEEPGKYANEYGYDTSYMEKKVLNIVRDGSTYLEGLRRSLEDYNMFLESCNRGNFSRQNSSSGNSTSWRPNFDPPSDSFSSSNFSQPMLNYNNYFNSTVPWRPNATDSPRVFQRGNNRNNRRMSCEEATEASEKIRRFAELAMWATRRLQDLGYAKKYQKIDEQEENELILKLAWFLDRLAYLSGYEPEYKEYDEPRGTSTPTTSPTPPTLVPASEGLTAEMMDCLKRSSSEPATLRCRYPNAIPDMMASVIRGGPSTTESSQPSNFNSVVPMNRRDNIPEQSEILVTSDNYAPPNYSPSRITKRATDYTYYFPAKPLHEMQYPVPIVKLIKHRLSNIKTVVKNLVERRLAHLAEKKEERHFEKRSIDETNVRSSNYINPSSNNPETEKFVEKRPYDVSSPLIHYPVSDVSVINTKSFRKRSVDDQRAKSNHIKSLKKFKFVKKAPFSRKKFEIFLSSKRSSKYPISKIKSIKKRFSDDPLSKLANYYIKYKVWDNSNPIHQKKNFVKKPPIFDVKNHLTEPKTIHKRSIFKKKVVHLHAPKPFQVVRTYLHDQRHKNNHKSILLTHLQKLHNLKQAIKTEKAHKITKRSLHYERMYLPRIPMDPQGDISYYVKNKEGTNINPDPVQAAQVRLGLEQVFQTGNIEVVHRFGSNYNPLNPAPFYTGILLTMADA